MKHQQSGKVEEIQKMHNIAQTYWNVPVEHFSYHSENNSDIGDFDISVEVIDDTTTLRDIEEEWNELIRNSSATIFQTFEWQYNWWKNFAGERNHHLSILLFYLEDHLIGIAPLFLQSHLMRHYKMFTQLKLLGSGLKSPKSPILTLDDKGPADYLDIIVEVGSEKMVAKTFAEYLNSHSGIWDEIHLQNIREDGIFSRYVIPALKKSDFSIKKRISDICPKIDLPETWNQYLESLQPMVREELLEICNDYLENEEFTIRDFCGKGNISGGMQSFSQLHQKRWNAINYPGYFSDERFHQLLKDITISFSEKKRLWFKSLRGKGKNIATHLGFKLNQNIYFYLSDYERERKMRSDNSGAGLALMLVMIKDAIDSKCNVLDMGRGCEKYKFKLTNDFTKNLEFIIKSADKISTRQSQALSAFKRSTDFYNILQRNSLRISHEISNLKRIIRENGKKEGLFRYRSQLLQRRSKKRNDKIRIKDLNIPKSEFSFRHIRNIQNEPESEANTGEKELFAKTPDYHLNRNAKKNHFSYKTDYLTNLNHSNESMNDWKDLELYNNTPLLSIDWVLSGAKAFCPSNALYVVQVKKDGKLNGIAPLCIKGNRMKRLEFIGTSILEEPGGFLYKDAESLKTLIRSLYDLKMPLYLRGLKLLSPETNIIEDELKKRKLISLVREEKIPFVDIDGSWDEFQKQISSSRRSSIRRLQRKAKKKGEVYFEAVNPTEENLEEYLEEVIRIEAGNWKGKIGTAIKTNPQLNTFFRIYSEKAIRNGNLRLFFLKVDGQTIAVQFAVVHSNRLWINKIGHDESWSWCSPGILLMHNVIRYCFDNGLTGCEFLGSDESWLHIWANGSHSLVTYKIFRKSPQGLSNLIWDLLQTYPYGIYKMLHKKMVK